MIGVLHCMTASSGRVVVAGYSPEDGGMIASFRATLPNWHEVVALVAITEPVRVLVSDVVIIDQGGDDAVAALVDLLTLQQHIDRRSHKEVKHEVPRGRQERHRRGVPTRD